MSRWEEDLVDRFLAEVPEDEDVQQLVDALADADAPPPGDLRARLMSEATVEGRFERFVETAAGILDVDADRMRELLDSTGDPTAWYRSRLPGVELIDLDGGPRVANAIRGFVRMPAGAEFPEHSHLGEEKVFVLQGSFVDGASGRVYRAGELATMPEGAPHGFRVRPGPDLVYLFVAQTGIRIGDEDISPDDPRV